MMTIAPEVQLSNHYGSKADAYSICILMYEVVTGEQAYSKGFSSKEFSFALSEGIIHGKRPVFQCPVKSCLRVLIEQCWSPNPRGRPTFREPFYKLIITRNLR